MDAWVSALRSALVPLADRANADSMRAYMKDVSPFLGVKSQARRTAVREVVQSMPTPDPELLADLSLALWSLDEREYQYAAVDILGRFSRTLPASFLASPGQPLLVTKPWWDTVDALGTAVVSPLTARFPEQVELMWSWCRSNDRWLIRAAIQHQRGRKADTDIDLLLAMCAEHAGDREFFIAKAIGWALRDASSWFPAQVQAFVDARPALSRVARTEALRGLARVAVP